MSEDLWEIGALVAATGGRPIGAMPSVVSGLSIDTRTLQPGDAFFAIKGDRFDGHGFLTAAVAAGASVLVVAEKKLPALGRVQSPMIVVDDVLVALGRLAEAARARSKAKIIAVTGSVGKTTTKEALRHALAASGPVHASAASFNNHWGVPLSLARMPADARYAVFEIGMNHPGEIRPLVKLVRPHVAIVTLIAPAHLGHFRDLDEIADAKAEIFEGLVVGGTALLNADDPQSSRLATKARQAGVTAILTFGESTGADVRLTSFTPAPESSRISAQVEGEEVTIALPVAGRHTAQNVLAVLGAAKLVGADLQAAAGALETWRSVKGRGQRHSISLPAGGSMVLIDDSYNANPASVAAAIAVLGDARPTGEGRRIAVLGDMLELGEHAPALHAGLAGALASAGLGKVFLAGEAMKSLDDALEGRVACEWHENTKDLAASLVPQLRSGDVVLVKASLSMGFGKIVERLLAAGSPEKETASEEGPADAAGKA
ncbi:UDP-N-acetylmuramoylalanyl-D-glutamyl-2,6-diaminopimelate--D-alanyl-D-alanine ligase [Consotaella salsifontis]|uniref:UDP-N-acetylmuramoyl-tripeptide--D-alanyl-D-alanine ligase n=1 Tax=Consotaella salsifontis TaxID=1365950 RepID=A0A1T4MAJ6_9HYPH|nr:UDP-N-acetylmuramoylalanyl-D-glutamyl-2,6-diaminopimelate--D-alanyl-D-alanine ligase [Consotaella salsifontis]SJZ63788.1 UDP-N-acetylmuramoyl-tripeptide--D-alanyl-D-alanine ligase [Consotaella salsifontis]